VHCAALRGTRNKNDLLHLRDICRPTELFFDIDLLTDSGWLPPKTPALLMCMWVFSVTGEPVSYQATNSTATSASLSGTLNDKQLNARDLESGKTRF
jgi:hypothetical protein